MTENTITNWKSSRGWGWGYSFTPTGDGPFSIEYPAHPYHTGTIRQVQQAIAQDQTFQSRGGTFYNAAWFWEGRRVTHTWTMRVVHEAPDLAIDYDPADHMAYAEWLHRNSQHHYRNDEYGYGWLPGLIWPDKDNTEITIWVA